MIGSAAKPQNLGRLLRTTIASWFEAFAGLALAALVFGLPHLFGWLAGLAGLASSLFVSDSKITSALAFGVAAAGAMLSISRHQIEAKISARMREVERLAELVDISNEVSHEELRELVGLYQRIADPNFMTVKQDIVRRAKRELAPMAFERESPPLSASVYTRAETERLTAYRGKRGVRVRALATLFEGDFDAEPTAEEEGFITANVELAKSGVDFERLFLMRSEAYAEAISRKSVAIHAGDRAELKGRVVFLEALRANDPALLRRAGDGFLIFGTDVGFVDRPTEDKFERGVIVTNPDRLSSMQQLYDDLVIYSYALSTTIHPGTGAKLEADTDVA